MTPEQILAVVATLLAGQPDTTPFQTLLAGGADPRYPVTIEACPRPLSPLDIERQTVICGRVNVPENHAAPQGRRIDLAFAVLKAKSLSPAPDPVVYLHGGPGGTSVSDLEFNARNFDGLRQRRDIVLFDQRAAGISSQTVSCFDAYADSIFDLAKKAKDGGSPEEISDTALLKSCLAEVEGRGAVLKDYNTTQNAYDVRAIMQALGYASYNAYGISYGTLLGQELLRSAPEGLRSVVLDSISAADTPSYDTNGVPLDEAIGNAVDQCTADKACAAAFPDFEATLKAVAERLRTSPIPATASRPEITLKTLVELFDKRNSLAFPPQATAYIPAIVTEWSKGESRIYDAFISGLTRRATTPEGLVTPYLGKVDVDQLAMAYAAAFQAEQLRQSTAATEVLLRQISAGRAKPDDLSGLESLLDKELSAVLKDMDPTTLIAAGKDYARFAGRSPSRDDIVKWIQTYFPAQHLDRLLAMVAVMTDSDVAAFHARAVTDTGKYTKSARLGFDLAIYVCQESFPFNSREGFERTQEGYRFPFIRDYVADGTAGLYDICAAFTPAPRPGFNDPVTSNIPVLALAGMNDTQTNPSAARRMTRSLANVQALEFPETGHGVIIFSRCAVDVGIAFIEHPDRTVDSHCTAKLKPDFVIPR